MESSAPLMCATWKPLIWDDFEAWATSYLCHIGENYEACPQVTLAICH